MVFLENVLQQLLAHSTITVSYGTGEELPPYQKGEASSWCTVVLQGRLHVVCGSEGFESDRGPWTVLGAPCLRRPSYIADFTAPQVPVKCFTEVGHVPLFHHPARKMWPARLAAARQSQRALKGTLETLGRQATRNYRRSLLPRLRHVPEPFNHHRMVTIDSQAKYMYSRTTPLAG